MEQERTCNNIDIHKPITLYQNNIKIKNDNFNIEIRANISSQILEVGLENIKDGKLYSMVVPREDINLDSTDIYSIITIPDKEIKNICKKISRQKGKYCLLKASNTKIERPTLIYTNRSSVERILIRVQDLLNCPISTKDELLLDINKKNDYIKWNKIIEDLEFGSYKPDLLKESFNMIYDLLLSNIKLLNEEYITYDWLVVLGQSKLASYINDHVKMVEILWDHCIVFLLDTLPNLYNTVQSKVQTRRPRLRKDRNLEDLKLKFHHILKKIQKYNKQYHEDLLLQKTIEYEKQHENDLIKLKEQEELLIKERHLIIVKHYQKKWKDEINKINKQRIESKKYFENLQNKLKADHSIDQNHLDNNQIVYRKYQEKLLDQINYQKQWMKKDKQQRKELFHQYYKEYLNDKKRRGEFLEKAERFGPTFGDIVKHYIKNWCDLSLDDIFYKISHYGRKSRLLKSVLDKTQELETFDIFKENFRLAIEAYQSAFNHKFPTYNYKISNGSAPYLLDIPTDTNISKRQERVDNDVENIGRHNSTYLYLNLITNDNNILDPEKFRNMESPES